MNTKEDDNRIQKLNKEFGRKLKTARRDKGVSQQSIANESGLGVNYISALENGHYKCNAYTLIAYAKTLDMSLDDIVGFVPSKHIIGELKDYLLGLSEEEQKAVLYLAKWHMDDILK